jgi:cysteine-rich repeat protein
MARLGTRAAVLLLGTLIAGRSLAASSQDYPGPCFGEVNASGVPLYLSADYRTANPVYGVVILPETGRFRLGISCVATGFTVAHVGPSSALCTVRGLCTPSQLLGLTEADIEAVRFIPNEVPFFHICKKHGFGWYDAVNVPAGIYLAAAQSRSAYWGLVDGHGTMDTYAFSGNGGSYQPVNCPRPPVCGNWIVEAGESCDDGNTLDGDCCGAACTFEPPGSACPGNGDLCTPGACSGQGACLHQNACIDDPIPGTKLTLEQKNGREKLLWLARSTGGSPGGGTPVDPTVTGGTLELFSPTASAVAMVLPAGGWTARGPSGPFKFSNHQAPDGGSSVRIALLDRGRRIKVLARRTGYSLTTPLTGIGIRLVAGTLATCSLFPTGTVLVDAPGLFEARGPGAIAPACDLTTLSQGVPPGGGDLNPGLPPDDPHDPSGGFCGPILPYGVALAPICPY